MCADIDTIVQGRETKREIKMGRAPCCDKTNVKKGPWSPEEDTKLKQYIEKHGTGGNWIALPQKAGLKRCGKSCRLRWLNYLRPNLKHGEFSEEEDRIICGLFANIGSRWSIIAAQLPGRTDNDIKNYWNTKLKKKLMGLFSHSQRKPIPFHSNHNAPCSFQSLSSSMYRDYIPNYYYTSSTASFPGLETISLPSNYSNDTTCYLAANHLPEVLQTQDIGMYGSMQVQYDSAAKESLLMFGHGREIKQEDEMVYHQNCRISPGVEENHYMLNYGIGSLHDAQSPLDYYDPEVIKQLISSNGTNSNNGFSIIFMS